MNNIFSIPALFIFIFFINSYGFGGTFKFENNLKNDLESNKEVFSRNLAHTPINVIRYVSVGGTGTGDGSSWLNASSDLQAMINISDIDDEIWVVEGTYFPISYPTGCTDCSSSRDFAFLLKNGVKIFGGFKGRELNLSERDPLKNITILSGDIGVKNDSTDNCYHVVISVSDFGSTVLDGFNITSGNANGTGSIYIETKGILKNNGGGVYIESSMPSIFNCNLFSNIASSGGGALINYNDSSPTISNCSFSSNISIYGGGILNSYFSNPIISQCKFNKNSASLYGGGMYNLHSSKPNVNNCTFLNNSAVQWGGAMYNYDIANPNILNCFFIDNFADLGGGIYNDFNSVPNITNCEFIKNHSINGGGSIFNARSSSPQIINCTITDNSSDKNGGGIYNYKNSNPTIINSILWGNGTEIINNSNSGPSSAIVSYSIVKGGYISCTNCPGGNGNLNPLFINSSDVEGVDNIYGTDDDGLALKIGSPAIDAGNPAISSPLKDITGFERTVPFDIGAFEYQGNYNCLYADKCSDITNSEILFPITGEDLNYVCIPGCLNLALPEDPNPPGCDFSQTPTVWYAIQTDNLAAQLFTTVESNSGTWQPIWSVFWGECSNLTNASTGNAPPCSNGDNSPDVHQVGVDNSVNTYYIAVTYDPNDAPTDGDSRFEICAATIEAIIVCLGDINDNCNPHPSTKIMITSRENADSEPNVDNEVGFMGPFFPGENVTVKIQFHYDATDSGADWLIGFIPDFGDGWDMEGYDFTLNPATGTPAGVAEWHEQNGSCAPLVAEHFSFLCTYTDEYGILHICNELCEACDCDKGYMDPLDPLPSGWFWISNGSNAGCVNSSCQPHQRWGIGSTYSEVYWEFPLKVKTFDPIDLCYKYDDLQISFQTFSDGGAGCWEDPIAECLIDRKQLGPLWKVVCVSPIRVIGSPQQSELCSGNNSNISLLTEDGSENIIKVTFEDNPNVTGEGNHIFNNGSGTIKDTLKLVNENALVPEIVNYYAQVEIAGLPFSGLVDTFQVIVYPLPTIIAQTVVPEICVSDLPYELEIISNVGYQGSHIYKWSDNISGTSGTGSFIFLNESFGIGSHIFSITVTDSLGCVDTGNMYANIGSVDTTVTKNGITLKAIENEAQYQWLNCYSGYAKIIGETGQSFTPIINGSFAVEIKKDGCIDTSSCHKVILTGIIENNFGEKFQVFPNPSNGEINIDLGRFFEEAEVTINSLDGIEINNQRFKDTSFIKIKYNDLKGVYILHIKSGIYAAKVKVVLY